MTSNSELVIYLKSLSRLFNDLVEKALEANIAIVNQEDYFLVMELFLPNVRELDQFTVFGALDFSSLGIVEENGRIILFDYKAVKEYVKQGDLGMCELSFAHELGHILNWNYVPPCVKLTEFTRFICQYSEARADQIAHELLEKSPFFEGRLLFNNSFRTPQEIWQHWREKYYLPNYARDALGCLAIAHHGLTVCPKIKEIKAIEITLRSN